MTVKATFIGIHCPDAVQCMNIVGKPLEKILFVGNHRD